MLTRPEDFDVIATLNLNGDYLSDALAAQVGGIGIAPGGNINYITGHAVFEATHGTAPKYANQDKVNPGSVILSGEMMFRYMGWNEAADLILKGLNGAIASKRVTYDFARLMEGATEIKCSAVRRQHHRAHVHRRSSRAQARNLAKTGCTCQYGSVCHCIREILGFAQDERGSIRYLTNSRLIGSGRACLG